MEPPSASDSSAMESIELDEMSLELSGAFWSYEELTHYHLKGHAESQQILARLLVLTIGRISKFIPPPWYKGVGVWIEPHPGVFDMLQYFETILPLVESL